MSVDLIDFDVAPYRLSGTVYGTLLNHRAALAQLGGAADEAPYKGAPRAPVLYVKPRNTLARTGDKVAVPGASGRLEVGAALGIVIGRTACGVCEQDALGYVAGYTAVADFSVPHETFYRPAVRFKALDGSCVVGPSVTPRERIEEPDSLSVRVYVDGELVHTTTTSGMVRSVARLLADVTDFMTLAPGDVLMLGVASGAPRIAAGHRVAVEIGLIGRLDNELVEDRP